MDDYVTFEAVLKGQGLTRNLSINFNNLHLVRPCMEYMASFKEALFEYMAHRVEEFSYPKLTTEKDVKAYLRRVADYEKGKVPEHHVPSSAFWLVDGQQYLGSGDVRHHLNDQLRRLGGNIGYAIRPAGWGRGLGTTNLALLLNEAKKLGIQRPVITCFDENIASYKVIEKNGGILKGKVENRVMGYKRLTRLYEIDIM